MLLCTLVVAAVSVLKQMACNTGPLGVVDCTYHLNGESAAIISGATCSADILADEDMCYEGCAGLYLEVTAPSELGGMRVCLVDNNFEPLLPDHHPYEEHPLNGKEMRILAFGSGGDGHVGCSGAESDKDYTDSIALIMRGDCAFSKKGISASLANASAALVFDNSITSSYFGSFISMGGTSGGVDILTLSGSSGEGRYLLRYLVSGGSLTGRLVMDCAAASKAKEQKSDALSSLIDDCGPASFSTKSHCKDEVEPADRLCSRCPTEMQLDNNTTMCLWGNNLLPRLRALNLFGAVELPRNLGVVYMSSPSDNGCSLADFAPHAGKVVVVAEPFSCLLYTSVELAQQAGVLAYVTLTPFTGRLTRLSGSSTPIRIPVHVTESEDAMLFEEFALARPATADGKGHALGEISFSEGTLPPYDPATPEPTPAPVEVTTLDDNSFQWSGENGALVALVVVLFILNVGHLARQHVRAREAPVAEGGSHVSIPLNAAYTGFSIGMLLLIAVFAFYLPYESGQTATDATRDDGKMAVNQTYMNAVSNIKEVNDRWRAAMVEMMLQGMDDFFNTGVRAGRTLQDVIVNMDGGYDSYEAVIPAILGVMKNTNWYTAVRTTGGQYIDDALITMRLSGVERLASYWYVEGDNSWTPHAFSTYEPFKYFGEYEGDTFELTKGLKKSESYNYVWYMGEAFPYHEFRIYSLQGKSITVPISLLFPLFNTSQQVVGTLELSRGVNSLRQAIISSVSSLTNTGNATSFVVLANDISTLISHSDDTLRTSERVNQGGIWRPVTQLYTLNNTQSLAMGAIRNYLKHLHDTGVLATGSGQSEFEQSEWYTQGASAECFHIDVAGGVLRDVTPNAYDVEQRQGGAAAPPAVVTDAERGEVLDFNGNATLHIYANLSVETPHVKDTRVSAEGAPWESSRAVYNTTTMAGGFEYVTDFMRGPVTGDGFSVSMMVNPRVGTEDDETPHPFYAPRLFTTSDRYGAALRWYANGVFYYGTSLFGCKTKPIPGGPPVGRWSHLVGTVDKDARRCRVWVDGVMHDETRLYMSNTYDDEGYLVGQMYDGHIDDVRLFNTSMNSREVAHLHSTGDYQRDVPQREWAFNFATHKEPGITDEKSLELMVVVLIPLEDVLREVDENSRLTSANLAIQEKNTETKIKNDTHTTILILAVIILFSVLMCLVLCDLLSRPFSVFAVMLTDAAVMKLDNPEEREYFITEMNVMHKAMLMMVSNLKEYRSYMPQSVLIAGEDNAETSDDESTFSTVTGPSTSNMSQHTSKHGHVDTLLNKKTLLKTLQLTKKMATFVALNIVEFHSRANNQDLQQLVDMHTSVLAIAIDLFTSEKGLVEPFSGDRLLCSFNALRALTTHRTAACSMLIKFAHTLENKSSGVKFTAAAASGEVFCGNMGTEGMRKCSFISPVVTWVYALERYCKEKGYSNAIDHFVSEDTKHEYMHHYIDLIEFPKRLEKPIRISTLIGKREVTAAEWMYVIEEGARNDPYIVWNKAFLAAINANCEEVEGVLPSLPAVIMERPCYQLLADSAQSGRLRPSNIPFH